MSKKVWGWLCFWFWIMFSVLVFVHNQVLLVENQVEGVKRVPSSLILSKSHLENMVLWVEINVVIVCWGLFSAGVIMFIFWGLGRLLFFRRHQDESIRRETNVGKVKQLGSPEFMRMNLSVWPESQ